MGIPWPVIIARKDLIVIHHYSQIVTGMHHPRSSPGNPQMHPTVVKKVLE
jgi:hypothetical protein